MNKDFPPKLCPKIILEGTRLTFKTEIAFKLNEHPRIVGPRKYRYHSPVISAEWCAFTNFPWGRGLVNFDPSEQDKAVKTYKTWLKLFELLKYYSWIIDRFHISTIIYQMHQGNNMDFGWLEKKLKSLGFCIIFCSRKPDSFQQARSERIKVSGNPSQYDNLDIFIQEQKEFRELISKSILPSLEVDVSEGDFNRICKKIADWMYENRLMGFYE